MKKILFALSMTIGVLSFATATPFTKIADDSTADSATLQTPSNPDDATQNSDDSTNLAQANDDSQSADNNDPDDNSASDDNEGYADSDDDSDSDAN